MKKTKVRMVPTGPNPSVRRRQRTTTPPAVVGHLDTLEQRNAERTALLLDEAQSLEAERNALHEQRESVTRERAALEAERRQLATDRAEQLREKGDPSQ